MIKTMLHNTKTGETRWGDEGLLAEWKNNPDLWVWADFDNADPEHGNAAVSSNVQSASTGDL